MSEGEKQRVVLAHSCECDYEAPHEVGRVNQWLGNWAVALPLLRYACHNHLS